MEEDKKDLQGRIHIPQQEMDEPTRVMSDETLKRTFKELEITSPALILLIGPLELVGRQWLLNKPEMLVGRGSVADICIGERSVSSTHAKIITNGEKIYLEDLNSTNGVFINNEKLSAQKKYVLTDQDNIKMGNAIFKYVEEGSPETMAYKRNQIDDLTNIYNKSALNSMGKEVFQKAKQMSLELAVIVFDLDNFKIINDTYGHLAGDFLLKELASLVKNQVIRSEDFFARFGGEEFCVVLCKNKADSLEVAERIRHIIEDHKFQYQGKIIPNVTISVGLAVLKPHINSWEDLFEQADKAVYVSKRSGKNKVSVA